MSKAKQVLNRIDESAKDGWKDIYNYEEWVDSLVEEWGSQVNYKTDYPTKGMVQAKLDNMVVGFWDEKHSNGQMRIR